MSFYLKPPRGIIEYHVLQKCTEERMKFFKNSSYMLDNPLNTEYLMEDCAFDRAGHFMLRLAAIQDSNFFYLFIHHEVQLLKLRLDNYSKSSTIKFLNKLVRHTSECLDEYGCNKEVVCFLRTLSNVVTKMCSRSYRKHILQEEHFISDKCKLFYVNVPYIYCTTLVSKRKVRLKNGYASIACDQWKDVLLSLFYTFLTMAITEMKYNRSTHAALNDHRVKSILSTIFNDASPYNQIKLQDFNCETKYFPLCMQNLQNVLQKNHRLPHEERYNYSLFLKDIGMSLEESLMFWKNEYSKDACGKCCHSWQKDEKRYVYSIRHMYGLEGSRKNYRSRSCHYFLNMSMSATQEGGCPFKHFDDENLKRILTRNLKMEGESIDTILMERTKSAFNACKLCMQISFKNVSDVNKTDVKELDESNFNFSTPVEYFYTIKSLK